MTEDLLALENQVCFGLAVAARSVIALYRPVLEPLNLTHPQYLVMLALWEREPRSVKELSDALQLEPATLSPLLKRLEANGYVERRRSSADERALEVTLTPAGRGLRAEAEKIPPRIVERLGLPMDDILNLRESLRTIIAAAVREPQA
ncbi:MarR family winged helix-turn-helix transcriptional regulator [Leifsonia shinshuensis]|uniref:MarR family transcriptional regulator n=1 Tax=Leifsonia shinshuensis TaxID=150026 RepID=A0A7G6YCF0_9MICO|nr:MarR family transcriptional regulator [Leifsonia shinshuensis]QNE36165.1 MarR family transcriptional regulator [Leifsonia shinshuensis]